MEVKVPDVWKEMDKWSKWCVAWIMWGLGLALPVILAMLVIRGSKAGAMVGEYAPVPTAEYLVWLMLFGMYYLYTNSKKA